MLTTICVVFFVLTMQCMCRPDDNRMTLWFPVFIAYEQNGQSVYEAWKTPSSSNDPPPFKNTGKAKHLRSQIIDHWSELKIQMINVALYKNNVQVAWMTFDGTSTNYLNWFSKDKLFQSSFMNLSQCSTTNFFSFDGDCRENYCRRMFINKVYPGCENDAGWFSVLDSRDGCKWGQFTKYPIFIYTANGGNWEKDSATADTLVISLNIEL